ERAGRAALYADIRDARGAPGLVTDAERIEKLQFAAGPHSARQRHRRQETASRRMTVGPEHRHRKHRLCQAPVDGERCGLTRLRLADLLEQRRAQPFHELHGDNVGRFRGTADPLPQMIEVELLGHDDFRTRGLGISSCSPMAGTRPYWRGWPTMIGAGAE